MKSSSLSRVRVGAAIAAASMMSLSGGAALAADVVAHDYVSTCRYEHPLDSYDHCEESSYMGQQASDCAESEALSKCREAYNSDCVKSGATYRTIISHEFLGYKACEATVVVHGYRYAK